MLKNLVRSYLYSGTETNIHIQFGIYKISHSAVFNDSLLCSIEREWEPHTHRNSVQHHIDYCIPKILCTFKTVSLETKTTEQIFFPYHSIFVFVFVINFFFIYSWALSSLSQPFTSSWQMTDA